MRQDENKGSITVFLAVTFIFIMAMLGTLIDGARLVEAHSQAYYATDLAATSALSEFDYKLKDRYGLFAYEGDPSDVIEYVVKQNLNAIQNGDLSESEELYQYIYDALISDISHNEPFDLLQFNDINASQFGDPITLYNKNEFERQIFEYVKFRGPVELFSGDLSFDLEALDEELKKAENEDSVDEIIRELEERLFDHIDAKGQYNVDMIKFREKMAKVSKDYYKPILDALENSPSLGGLSSLKGKMDGLAGQVSVDADCDALISQIVSLENEYNGIKERADDIKNGFSGSGDTAKYNDMPISGEMLENYKIELEDIKEKAELRFGSLVLDNPVEDTATNSDLEKQKYQTIKSSSTQIKNAISGFKDQIESLEDRAEELAQRRAALSEGEDDSDLREDEEELEDDVEMLWNSLKTHFHGSLYVSDSVGVFPNAAKLRELIRIIGPATADKTEDWVKKAKEDDEKEESSSRVFKSIPDNYSLPDSIPQADIDNKLAAEFESDFNGGRSDTKTKRDSNRDKTKGIKNLFNGVGTLTLDTLDNAMLGLYALGNFENALCYAEGKPRPSGYSHTEVDISKYSLNMRNDSIENFFEDCEVEYLIKGNLDEKKNYQGIRNELTGIYFVLNYAGVRKAPTLRASAEGIAYAVEAAITVGTLGVGAAAGRAAFYATREACYAALATIQTCHDLERLYLGNRVPLFKKTDSDFCGVSDMVGLGASICADNAPTAKLPMSYTDYLYVRMILTGHDKLVGRLQNLVEVNMNDGDAGRSIKLDEMYTSASVKTSVTMPFFFINVMFMAENFDGTGMTITKYASKRY